MANLFGTDGVRGIANRELTGELAYKLGRAGAYYLTGNHSGEKRPSMLVGKDTRISGDMLESALVAGITSAGIDVIKLGIIPTPGVAYLCEQTEAAGGIMISASHNPIADNGIKFFDKSGLKLNDEMENDIERIIEQNYEEIPLPTHKKIGRVEENGELVDKYLTHLLSTVHVDLSGLHVVLDCAYGAAYYIAREALKRSGVQVDAINYDPDGEKINVNCGSTNPEMVREKVLKNNADLGIAHDGDADRLVLVDESGYILDGDYIMAILALSMLKKGELKQDTLVTTRYSNFALGELLAKNNAHLEITKNGDRYILQKMLAEGYNLGGEKSGHIIYLDYSKTGDGVLTALQILQVMRETGKSLSELASVLKPWPQVLENVPVKNKEGLYNNKLIKKEIEKAEKDFGQTGRVFIRASGTEPLVRIMLEAKDKSKLNIWSSKLVEIIGAELN